MGIGFNKRLARTKHTRLSVGKTGLHLTYRLGPLSRYSDGRWRLRLPFGAYWTVGGKSKGLQIGFTVAIVILVVVIAVVVAM